MAQPSVIGRRAGPSSLEYVEELLAAEGLPTADLRSSPAQFYVFEADEPVGIGGLERYDRDALLRSVVVEPSARGRGYGTAICGALERRAREAGVDRLYLLTTTAAAFFADRSYERVERSDAPAPIRESAEFTDLCSDAATAMRRRL